MKAQDWVRAWGHAGGGWSVRHGEATLLRPCANEPAGITVAGDQPRLDELAAQLREKPGFRDDVCQKLIEMHDAAMPA